MNNKTARIASRITYKNKNKLSRYYDSATLRELLKAIIQLSEEVPYIRKKLNEVITKNRS